MSLETIISADFGANAKLAQDDLAYLSQRAKSTCYDFVMRKFLASGISKAELARRIGKTQPQISHVLATPANWTIKTLAELLAGISKEEFIPGAASIQGRAPRNVTQRDVILRRSTQLRQDRHETTVKWETAPPLPQRVKIHGDSQWSLEDA